ncbi:OpgC domain-containing protein, partial [Corynebacterium variabile]|uniref:OpgC domain-containing protein n=1 Tax=Corynebacterium variabile TaxID=1727 RepID=UPI0028A90F96
AVYAAVGLRIYTTNDHFNLGLNGPVRLFLASVGIIAVISAVSALEGSPLLRPLIAVGSRTLTVFIMHIMVLATVIFVADLVLPGDPGLPLQPLILAAIVVTLCLGLHRLLTACGFEWLFRRAAWTRQWYLRQVSRSSAA